MCIESLCKLMVAQIAVLSLLPHFCVYTGSAGNEFVILFQGEIREK